MTMPDQIQITYQPKTMATPVALTSDDIPPGPLSEDDLRRGWNQQANEHNQWESLDSAEQLAWAQALAIKADRHASAAIQPAPERGEGPTLDDVDELCVKFGFHYDNDQGKTLEMLRDMISASCARWGSPHAAALAPGENLAADYIDSEHTGQDRELLEVFYQACNNEGGTADEIHLRGIKAVLAAMPMPQPEGDWFTVATIAQDMRSRGLAEQMAGDRLLELANGNRSQPARPATPSAPEAPGKALAARPLLEKVARLDNSVGIIVAEVRQLAGQAAAWLRENPPGQPVAIEPRGCPTPGACSCVEPTPPAPQAGEVEA